jgi:putative heme-binding domain-containing protein
MISTIPTLCRVVLAAVVAQAAATGLSETLRHPETLEEQLKGRTPNELAAQANLRGDARRGAVVFFTSAAGCVKCHGSGDQANPLGPDLATLGEVTDQHIVESLLFPSKAIRQQYQTRSILTDDGTVVVGLIARSDDQSVVLRAADDLTKETVIDRDSIVQIKTNDQSMMPEGLVGALPNQRDFLDLVRYISEVAAGGPRRAHELRPGDEQLAVRDDTSDLDHAGIIRRLRSRDFDAGKGIYQGYCYNCHGREGNTPSLPTARAFGTQKLKFGSDPYSMFMTLSRGNGLMAAMNHLTPKERYQVVHYIREEFMKPSNPDYFEVDKAYLAKLPEGSKDGTEIDNVRRDFGGALASQLRRDFSSVLTVKVGGTTISYDLHSMDQADIWRDGFLDLSETQHARGRGEGTANPDGEAIPGLDGWAWGHDGSLDYPREGLLPRGPLPDQWMHYAGHYRHGNRVVLRYSIDGREILETPQATFSDRAIGHHLRIQPGRTLVLAAAQGDPDWMRHEIKTLEANGNAAPMAVVSGGPGEGFTAAALVGDTAGLRWQVDDNNRLVLTIPSDARTRQFQVIRYAGNDERELDQLKQYVVNQSQTDPVDFTALTAGGPPRWPDVLETTGYLGLERGGYALDTISIPESTPWNTWFRTSALDFFADGRMVVATHGGDIWVVSGVDETLLNLRWKRFAGGLYEPFGVKVVDDRVYVTCKDRLVRLHDLNADGEADFYESFSADEDVSVNFHAFNFDLQTDDEGNFYYAKSGHGSDSDIPGAVIKVSPDGKYREVFSTGFRTPNGLGSLPDGRITASDNQGQWMPASKVSLMRRGGFYGWVNNYSLPGKWEPGGGTIDLEAVVPPETFDQPLVWMPQEFDNSSGGQLWAGDPRWGPLSGHLLHTSFGKGWMYYMMLQDLPETSQAAIIKLPFDFSTGIMRAAVNPADGQVYACGLQGWNGGGRSGLLDKGIQRLRYTGKPYRMVSDCRVEPDGLLLRFNFELDRDSATDAASYDVKHWNYKWQKSYGSDRYSPSTGRPGVDPMNITSITLQPDGKSVKLHVPDLKPVNQVHVLLDVQAADGQQFAEEIYWTINAVPE